MTMLARLTEVLRCARMRGDWDDERVVLEVLAEMRDLGAEVANIGVEARWQSPIRDANNVREIWQHMIDAIRAEATEPATCPPT
jgi:hypothetical protein